MDYSTEELKILVAAIKDELSETNTNAEDFRELQSVKRHFEQRYLYAKLEEKDDR